jgi:hypothetical protein
VGIESSGSVLLSLIFLAIVELFQRNPFQYGAHPPTPSMHEFGPTSVFVNLPARYRGWIKLWATLVLAVLGKRSQLMAQSKCGLGAGLISIRTWSGCGTGLSSRSMKVVEEYLDWLTILPR